jgi:hypothetical protein
MTLEGSLEDPYASISSGFLSTTRKRKTLGFRTLKVKEEGCTTVEGRVEEEAVTWEVETHRARAMPTTAEKAALPVGEARRRVGMAMGRVG